MRVRTAWLPVREVAVDEMMPIWAKMLAIYGPMAVVLLFFMYASWKAGKWIGQRIIEPLAQRHVAMIDSIEANLKAQNDHMAVEEQTQSRLAECYEKLCEKVT